MCVMEIGTEILSCEQAKQMDIVDYLAVLGHRPSRIRNNDYWYLSPLRTEKTASFKVNRKLNSWYDHGLGQGGNLLDFGVLYHNCTVSELLNKLNGNLSFHQQPSSIIIAEKEQQEPLIQVVTERNLVSLSLFRYIRQRRIAEEVGNKYCREIIFALNNKQYTAIGFRNDEGGYELRNQWFKGSSSPKGITTFNNNAKELLVFEGFFNFLSHQTIHQHQPVLNTNFLILNSTSFFEKSRQYMEQHQSIHLFLDRDKTGQNCTRQALVWNKKYSDESKLYEGYNDLNDWMQKIGKSHKKSIKQGLK